MAKLNDWLTIDKLSGEGNAQITLTASSSQELNDRVTSLRIDGKGVVSLLNVRQLAFVPSFTLSDNILNFTSLGGEVDILIDSNISWVVADNPSWLNVKNMNSYAGITITVGENDSAERNGKITFTDTTGSLVLGEINITQSEVNYDELGFAELIYETDTDGETIRLFGADVDGHLNSYLTQFKPSSGERVKWGGVTNIVIDGIAQEWNLEDEFYFENAGEHIVRVRFRDNKIEPNASTGGGSINTGGSTSTEVTRQYPFWGNPNLKRAKLPSALSADCDGLFRKCNRLESVVIENESCMGNYFTALCDNILTVTLPSTLTTISNYAFYGCSKLAVSVPSVISEIGDYAFYGCSVTNGVLDLRNVISIGSNAFYKVHFEELIVGDRSSSDVYKECTGTIRFDTSGAYAGRPLTSGHFNKVIYMQKPWFDQSSNYVEDVEFNIFGSVSLPSLVFPSLKKITIKSFAAPILTDSTINTIKYNNGTLHYPQGADYTSLLSSLLTWKGSEYQISNIKNNKYFWIEVNDLETFGFVGDCEFSFNQIDWNKDFDVNYNGFTLIPNVRVYVRGALERLNGVGLGVDYKVGGDLSSLGDITERHYRSFFGGTNLVDASELILPWTVLTERCFEEMFVDCKKLTAAPQLPATILATSCYEKMFYGCSSLTTAPILPSETLVERCYAIMFYWCSNLNYIKMLAYDGINENNLFYWVDDVSTSGTFVKHPNASIPSGESGIPTNWTIETATE